jgi:hypothetical protein
MKTTHIYTAMMLFFCISIFGQVGINTDKPDQYTGLHVSERMNPESTDSPDKYNGVMIPRYTSDERDAELTPNIGAAQNSLLIFNTTDNCYNFWSWKGTYGEWESLYGAMGNATFDTIVCSTDISVNGTYIQGSAVNGENYLSITVNVIKPGNYVITGNTTNGYSFYTSGTALNAGTIAIMVPGQGTPQNVGTDNVSININNTDIVCDTPPQVKVGDPAPTYTINCSAVNVNPLAVFTTTKPAESDPNNTVSVSINVTAATPATANVSITTNTVNGVSFSGAGICPATGTYKITLYPVGTLTGSEQATFTLYANSAGGNTYCDFTITPVVPKLVGGVVSWSTGDYGLTAPGTNVNSNQTGNMMANPANFGPNGIVKYAGQGITVTTNGTTNNIPATLGATPPPDIVFISYNKPFAAADATALQNYIAAGGVVIFAQPEGTNTTLLPFLKALYPSDNVTLQGESGLSKMYKFGNFTGDPIINGPFMDLSSKVIGEDGGSTEYVTPIPAGVTNYLNGNSSSSNTYQPIANTSFMFRDNTRNFIYIGDGGFWRQTTSQDSPFTVNDYPVMTTGGINAVPAYRYVAPYSSNTYGAFLLANVMAWALHQATTTGINAAAYTGQ